MCRHKGAREQGVRDRADQHKHRQAIGHHRIALIRLVADALIVCENDPSAAGDLGEPFIVGSVRRKVVGMGFNKNPCRPEDGRELFTKIAIGEEDVSHAALS